MAFAYSKRTGLSPVPNVGEVTRQVPRDDEYRIDADIVAIAGIARCQSLRGHCDTAQPIFIERPCGRFRGAALLDLDESEDPTSTRNEIDLAAGNASAPRKNSPAVQSKPPCGNGFCPAAPGFGLLST
jgi:hypothetical protein